MSDNVHHQEAVQKALVDTNPSDQQNITINLNFNFNTNNHHGDNISLYSSSSSSINSVNIGEYNHYNQPLRIQTEPFLNTTVYDSDKGSPKKRAVLEIFL